MERMLYIFVILICVVLIIFFMARNKYEKTGSDGEIVKRKSCELLERVEDAVNLIQLDKARLEIIASDIKESTRDALFYLIAKRIKILKARQELFGLNEDGFYEGNYFSEEDEKIIDRIENGEIENMGDMGENNEESYAVEN